MERSLGVIGVTLVGLAIAPTQIVENPHDQDLALRQWWRTGSGLKWSGLVWTQRTSVHVPMTIVVAGACLGRVLGVEMAEARGTPSGRLPLLSW